MRRATAAGRANQAIAVCVGSLLIAGTGLSVLFMVRHPSALPVHVTVPRFYEVPVALAFAGVSVAILRRLPSQPIGWLFGLLGIILSYGYFTNAYAAWRLPGTTWVLWIWVLFVGPAVFSLAMALLLFPTGRTTSSKWQWLARLLWLYLGASVLVGAAAPWPNRVDFFDVAVQTHLGWPNNPLSRHAPGWLADANSLVAPVGVALVLASLMSLLPRWRRSTGDEREQIKWFGLAALLFGVVLMVGLVQFAILGMPEDDATGELIGNALFQLVLVGIPVAIGLGVVRFRLYEIDTYISRVLVFGGLAVLIALAYVIGVMLVGMLVGEVVRWTEASTWVALAATAGVAVAFQPLRTRLQSGADRLVFGDRARPYELMTRFGHELEAALAPTDVLARIAETVGRAVNSHAVRVSTTLASGEVLVARWPPDHAVDVADAPYDVVLPMVQDGTALAEIAVGGSAARSADLALLQHIVAVSTGALRNFRLLAELKSLHQTIERQNAEVAASKARLSAAAEAERRRLQRVVANRIGPDLDVLRTALPTLRSDLDLRPDTVVAECERLAARASHIVDELRELSRGIHPTILVDHGLAAALRAMLRRLELPVELDVAAAVAGSRYAAAVETTVYLCCQAALEMTAAQHNRSTAAALRLWRDNGSLAFSLWHDAERGWNDDLTALRDRITTLGGDLVTRPDGQGSVLCGVIPVAGAPPADGVD